MTSDQGGLYWEDRGSKILLNLYIVIVVNFLKKLEQMFEISFVVVANF